jgi:hypothetical protein
MQQAELTPSNPSAGDEFGGAVAISGSTAVVGAWGTNGNTGAAYVFTRSGTSWSQRGELTASDAAPGDEFGAAVAIYGSTAVAGAPVTQHQGAAYVFVRSGGAWSQQAELTASDAARGDRFGASVAVYGSTALIGAAGKNTSRGSAYVFTRSGTAWSQQAELTETGGHPNDSFGSSVALSASAALIGAFGTNTTTGAAYAFTRSGTTWSQVAELTAADGAGGDWFGYSVAISGTTGLVGAYWKNNLTGAAYVFANL